MKDPNDLGFPHRISLMKDLIMLRKILTSAILGTLLMGTA